MGPMTVVLIWVLGHGPMVVGCGLMVVGGGDDGLMVDDCGSMGISHGPRCSVFNGIVGFGLGLYRSTG